MSISLNECKSISEEYGAFLALQGSAVAVKMLPDAEELDKIHYKGKPVRKVSKRLVICQLFAQARFYGRVIGGTEESLNLCRLGADALGFEVDDYTHVYSGSYFNSDEAAQKMIATMPKLERGKYHALLVAPLERCPVEPDVVLFYGNAAQILRLVHGYLYNKGGRVNFSSSGDAGICCDPLVVPMQTGEPGIGLPCNGGRIMSLPNSTDIVCGVPFKILDEVLEGIKFTHLGRGAIRYPIAWQHIDWEPQPPVLYFIRPELSPGENK